MKVNLWITVDTCDEIKSAAFVVLWLHEPKPPARTTLPLHRQMTFRAIIGIPLTSPAFLMVFDLTHRMMNIMTIKLEKNGTSVCEMSCT